MRLSLAALVALFVLVCAGSAQAVTVGKTNTTSTYNNSQISAGAPQVYRFVAGTSGSVDHLNLYVGSGSTASTAKVGIYAGTSSAAGSLLGACTITSPPAAAWSSCAISSVQVTAGAYYWLAVLQPSGVSGTLYWREGALSGSATNAGPGGKTALPATWVQGTTWSGYTASIFADAQAPPPADTTPPDTIIDSAPADGTDTSASISFHSTETGSTFSCALDGVQAACSSPATYSGLSVGAHTFTVAAKDAAGNVDPTPASASWTVQDPPPAGSCAVSTPNVPDGPDPWGGCWPGPSNTGVPSGVTLTAYTGPCTITADNTVINAKHVLGPDDGGCDGLAIMAHNVTITNSQIDTHVRLDQDQSGSATWSFSISDSEVAPHHDFTNWSGLCCGRITATRVDLHEGQNGLDCELNNVSCSITDSYIHDQYLDPTGYPHLGGIRLNGAHSTTIQHNVIWCTPPVNVNNEGCTGDMNVLPQDATNAVVDALIQRNLLGDNSANSYCADAGSANTSNNDWVENVFMRGNLADFDPVSAGCGYYGPVTGYQANPGNSWTGNVWDDGSAVAPN